MAARESCSIDRIVPKCIRPKPKGNLHCSYPNPAYCLCIGTNCLCACVRCGGESSYYPEHLRKMAKTYKKQYDRGERPSLLALVDEIEKAWPRRMTEIGFLGLKAEYDTLPAFTLSDAIAEEGGDGELEFFTDSVAGRVVKRTTTGEMRALIHLQVTNALESYVARLAPIFPRISKYVRGMVPAFLGVDKNEDRAGRRVVYYTERVDGVSLADALVLGIDEADVRMTMLALHSMLESFKSIGFVHGNLRPQNVMLRGYGQGEEYPVPILVEGVGHIAILPFLPTLTNFDFASTQRYSSYLPSLSPYVNETSDVILMYAGLDLELPSTHPFREAAKRIERVCGEGWQQASYVPPLPLRFSDLSHEAMMGLYLGE